MWKFGSIRTGAKPRLSLLRPVCVWCGLASSECGVRWTRRAEPSWKRASAAAAAAGAGERLRNWRDASRECECVPAGRDSPAARRGIRWRRRPFFRGRSKQSDVTRPRPVRAEEWWGGAGSGLCGLYTLMCSLCSCPIRLARRCARAAVRFRKRAGLAPRESTPCAMAAGGAAFLFYERERPHPVPAREKRTRGAHAGRGVSV